MSKLFENHAYSSRILKYKELPVFKTMEFDFYRSVNVENWSIW